HKKPLLPNGSRSDSKTISGAIENSCLCQLGRDGAESLKLNGAKTMLCESRHGVVVLAAFGVVPNNNSIGGQDIAGRFGALPATPAIDHDHVKPFAERHGNARI